MRRSGGNRRLKSASAKPGVGIASQARSAIIALDLQYLHSVANTPRSIQYSATSGQVGGANPARMRVATDISGRKARAMGAGGRLAFAGVWPGWALADRRDGGRLGGFGALTAPALHQPCTKPLIVCGLRVPLCDTTHVEPSQERDTAGDQAHPPLGRERSHPLHRPSTRSLTHEAV